MAKAGRNGRWTGFLREHSIPKATADRYVKNHAKTLAPVCVAVTESVQDSAKQIQKLVKQTVTKVNTKLTSIDSVQQFLTALSAALLRPLA